MKILVDKNKLTGKYDERNLTISQSGLHKYPSKKMFVEFLKQYKDIKATADIWGTEDITNSTVTINVEVKYKVPNLPKSKRQTQTKVDT